MPLLAGLISTMFGTVASYLAARMSIGFAAAAAFILTSGVAYLAVKAALAALAGGISAALPPTVYALLSYCWPSNAGVCITAVLIGDAVSTAWDYWRVNLGIAVNLAKG